MDCGHAKSVSSCFRRWLSITRSLQLIRAALSKLLNEELWTAQGREKEALPHAAITATVDIILSLFKVIMRSLEPTSSPAVCTRHFLLLVPSSVNLQPLVCTKTSIHRVYLGLPWYYHLLARWLTVWVNSEGYVFTKWQLFGLNFPVWALPQTIIFGKGKSQTR